MSVILLPILLRANECVNQRKEYMEEEIGIFKQSPENFNHDVQVSACVIQVDNQILALQRGFHKYDPGKWEVSGGKFGEGETLNFCASRELFEETGIVHDTFQEIGVLYVRRKEGDFTLRIVIAEFLERPQVKLSNEHHDFRWVTAEEMRDLDLIKGEELLVDMYQEAVASENS